MIRAVFVIDSDAAQRQLICAALRDKLAYKPISLADGKEAADYIGAEKTPQPDLIILDVSNTTGGCQTISTLRQMAAHVPIVVLVRYGDYETAMQMLDAGAQDFLSKPAAIERIGTTLKNALHLRDTQREVHWLRRRGMAAPGMAKETSADRDASVPLFSFMNGDGHIRRMEDIEAEAIRFALHYYDGRITEVARHLGIGRSTLYRKMSELGQRQRAVA